MTIKDILIEANRAFPDAVSLRYKREGRWQTRTFNDLYCRSRCVTEILATFGIENGDRVAILQENSPEWYELYFGIVSIGAIAVPVDAKLCEQEVAHIVHDCSVSVLFCSQKKVELVSEIDSPKSSLHSVIVLEGETHDLPSSDRIQYAVYEELLRGVEKAASGKNATFNRCHPTPADPASFMYTSGTTGRQKGAVLTHQNFVSNVESCMEIIEVDHTDCVLLILPLHHSFAFTTTLLLPVYAGCQVAFIENIKTIKRNMQECQPTILLAVPLLLEKMLGRVLSGIKKNKMAWLLYRIGLGRLVGKRVNASLGGKLRLMASGGAPISPDTLSAWTRLGFTICEGYGITETAPVLTFNPIGAARVGTVGLPIRNVRVRLDQPNENGVGEIIVAGPNVMQGYYNNPKETEKVLKDGWYYTGDMGYFDEAGYLVINGRKKSLIVNREGKNVYPEEIEQQVNKSPYILESLVLGFRSSVDDVGERVGLIAVPDLEAFDALECETTEKLADADIEEKMQEEIRRQLQALADYKRPRRVQIRFEPFEKTTTQKIKRFLYAIDIAKLE